MPQNNRALLETLKWFSFASHDPVQQWIIFLTLAAVSLLLMLALGNPLIHRLRGKRWRKDAETWAVREDTPETHQVKQGTPSMGGIGIVGVALVTYLFVKGTLMMGWAAVGYGAFVGWWREAVVLELLFPLIVIFHAGIGFVDDWSKATGRGGLRARSKFGLQAVFALAFVASLFQSVNLGGKALQGVQPLWFATVAVALVVILIGTCNAVNLTDGIDGLAAGLAIQSGVALLYTGINNDVALNICLLWAGLIGSCFGFLWFNKYPARVFMGDTGSLAIGAALGAAGIALNAVCLLPFIGFIFYIEATSVILQVAWFKWTRKRTGTGQRLLLRAPLHHHFELGGWSERRVVATFWAVNFVTTIIGLTLWRSGVLPQWPPELFSVWPEALLRN